MPHPDGGADRPALTAVHKPLAGHSAAVPGITRRHALAAIVPAAAALAAPLVLTPRKAAAAQRITVTTPGGPYVQAYAEAVFKPFNEAMKGRIEAVGIVIPSNPTAQAQAMADSRSYEWDLVALNGGSSLLLAQAGCLEKLQLEHDPDVSEIPAQFKTPYMIGCDLYATIIGYRTDTYPASGRRPLAGWKDLWDVEGLPGRRSLRKHPYDTTEEALMADGVDPAKLYPLDFDRAFRSLDRIKPHVKVWWDSGAQVTQLLISNEVDMAPNWNSQLQNAIDAGAPLAIGWNEGLVTWWGWNILKGNPKADACRELIRFAANAQRQAMLPKYVSVGPCNLNAYKYIDPKIGAHLPSNPDNLAQMIQIDGAFWSGAKDQAIERFNEWILS